MIDWHRPTALRGGRKAALHGERVDAACEGPDELPSPTATRATEPGATSTNPGGARSSRGSTRRTPRFVTPSSGGSIRGCPAAPVRAASAAMASSISRQLRRVGPGGSAPRPAAAARRGAQGWGLGPRPQRLPTGHDQPRPELRLLLREHALLHGPGHGGWRLTRGGRALPLAPRRGAPAGHPSRAASRIAPPCWHLTRSKPSARAVRPSSSR
jgi:hypothetical protein